MPPFATVEEAGTPVSTPLPALNIRRLQRRRAELLTRIATAATEGRDTEVVYLAKQLDKVLGTLALRALAARATGNELDALAAAS